MLNMAQMNKLHYKNNKKGDKCKKYKNTMKMNRIF